MTAAITLSIPHAPSFPLYTVLARVFIDLLPFGALPLRCNYFSAFLGATTVLLLFLLCRRFMGHENPWVRDGSSFLIAGLVGMMPSFFANSVVTEVFSLNTLFVVLLMFFCVQPLLFSFLLGLSLGNHHIIVLMAPLAAILHVRAFRRLPHMVAAFLLGFSIYLFLPLRSSQNPPLNWGNPTTMGRFIRTLTRQDYGSLKLSLGEQPERNLVNTLKQVRQFFVMLATELPWWLILLGLTGLILGAAKRDPFWVGMLICFLLSGPGFTLLSNMPMTSQTIGIMGRFMIMPALLVVFGCVAWGTYFSWKVYGVLIIALVSMSARSFSTMAEQRSNFLVWDYGQMLLRHLPHQAALFLDGGDDAFYSLALLHHGLGMRPDVKIHDRGGLVFKNPYGDDFRKLSKEEKQSRRAQIELGVLQHRNVYYSTMDPKTLVGNVLVQQGFLYANSMNATNIQGDLLWSLMAIRSLYPVQSHEFRVRSLAAFFPYMRGRELLEKGNIPEALRYFRRAAYDGHDSEWFRINQAVDYSLAAYRELIDGRLDQAEMLYKEWLAFDPTSEQAQSNLGVVYEKSGRVFLAEEHYRNVMNTFPNLVDPVYNLAVLAWRRQDWPTVERYLNEALRRNPNHGPSRATLERLKGRT